LILVIGRVRCEADRREELMELAKTMQERSRLEDGCIRYGFFAAIEDPLSFIAVEEWADREALDRHFGEAHLADFARGLGEVVSERPEVAIHEISATSGFPGVGG
jgi:quinol monooxygenase YgiN